MKMGTNAYVSGFPVASRFVAIIRNKGSVGSGAVLEGLENFFDARWIAVERMRAKYG
jgi:hypothetical protein